LVELGHEVTVANPRRLKLITASNSKRDRTDAEWLARLARGDATLLSPVQHRNRKTQADLSVIRARDGLVRARTLLVNMARGLTKTVGERLPKCTAKAFHNMARAAIPEDLKPALGPVFDAIEELHRQIRRCNKSLEEMAERYPDTSVVSQPSGVGILTALTFQLVLGDKERFRKSRAVGAFVGMRPRLRQSGDSDAQLHITKEGDPLLRRLLIQSANYILGPYGRDSDLRRWGLEIGKRGGKNGKRRAKVAVARKLAVLMHRLWVTGEIYEPIGYGKKNQAA
jgi:transposase